MAPDAEGNEQTQESQREKIWEQDWENEEQIRPPWYWWLRFAYVLLFALVLFLLGESMVRHHFFTGGAQDNRSTGGPTGP